MNTHQHTINIKPAEGLIVRDPVTRKPLAKKGEKKPKDAYWMRRLRDGDVMLCKNGDSLLSSPAKPKSV